MQTNKKLGNGIGESSERAGGNPGPSHLAKRDAFEILRRSGSSEASGTVPIRDDAMLSREGTGLISMQRGHSPSSSKLLDEILNGIAKEIGIHAGWLSSRFGRIPPPDCEDLFQNLLLEIRAKGIERLGVEELVGIDLSIDPAVIKARLLDLWRKIIVNFRRQLANRARDFTRRKPYKNRAELDEVLLGSLIGSDCPIAMIECAEHLAELNRLSSTLSERETIVFGYWLKHPGTPKLSDLYDSLTDAQKEIFLPRDLAERNKPGKILIKSQLSRTRSSVLKWIRSLAR